MNYPSNQFNSKKTIDIEPTVGILLDSRTVVEKKDFVSTGILTYAEGDIIEIEISEFKLFHLGDSVKLTVYSLGGIYTIHTNVVAKDDGAIVVLNPPENQKKFLNRREFPRIDLSNRAIIHAIGEGGIEKISRLDDPIQVLMDNLSLNGVGFLGPENLLTHRDLCIEMEFNIGTTVPCSVHLVRTEKREKEIFYGGQIIWIPDDKLISLRSFILRTQVENRFKLKRKDNKKRIFG